MDQGTGRRSGRSTAKVMLIDDDRSLHAYMRRIMKEAGYEFCGAMDGLSGLEMLVAEKPDLLLLDVMMPGMNGFEVCRTMRESGRRTPVIFLSAKGDIVDKSIGFNAGGDDYVVKPFSSDELLLRVQAHLRRHRDDLAFARAVSREGSRVTGELEILFNQYEVYLRGEPVNLTAKEFEILALLAATQVRCSPVPRSTSTSGARTPPWTRAPSPCSCARSARRSKTTPLSPATFSPSGVSVTSSPNRWGRARRTVSFVGAASARPVCYG